MCEPAARPFRLWVSGQPVNAAPSRLHWYVAPAAFEPITKVTAGPDTVPGVLTNQVSIAVPSTRTGPSTVVAPSIGRGPSGVTAASPPAASAVPEEPGLRQRRSGPHTRSPGQPTSIVQASCPSP